MGGRTSGSSTDPSLEATSTLRRSFGTKVARSAPRRGGAHQPWPSGGRHAGCRPPAWPAPPARVRVASAGRGAPGGSSHQAMPCAGLPMSMDARAGSRWSSVPMRGSTRRPDSVRVTSMVTSAAVGRKVTGAALRPDCTKGSPRAPGFAQQVPEPATVDGLESHHLIGVAVQIPASGQPAEGQQLLDQQEPLGGPRGPCRPVAVVVEIGPRDPRSDPIPVLSGYHRPNPDPWPPLRSRLRISSNWSPISGAPTLIGLPPFGVQQGLQGKLPVGRAASLDPVIPVNRRSSVSSSVRGEGPESPRTSVSDGAGPEPTVGCSASTSATACLQFAPTGQVHVAWNPDSTVRARAGQGDRGDIGPALPTLYLADDVGAAGAPRSRPHRTGPGVAAAPGEGPRTHQPLQHLHICGSHHLLLVFPGSRGDPIKVAPAASIAAATAWRHVCASTAEPGTARPRARVRWADGRTVWGQSWTSARARSLMTDRVNSKGWWQETFSPGCVSVRKVALPFGRENRVSNDRLSPLDASFLHLEDDVSHMHIASVAIFEGPPPLFTDVLAMVEPSWPWSPATARWCAPCPSTWAGRSGSTTPTSTSSTTCATPPSPRPGAMSELRNLVGRVMSQQLDRSKPLWEIWMVEGLEDGRWAMLSKTHHAMVDGVSGTDLLAVIMDISPDAERPAPVAWEPRPTPDGRRLADRRHGRFCAQPLRAGAGRPVLDPVRAPGRRLLQGGGGAGWRRWRAWCGPPRSRASTVPSGPIAATPGPPPRSTTSSGCARRWAGRSTTSSWPPSPSGSVICSCRGGSPSTGWCGPWCRCRCGRATRVGGRWVTAPMRTRCRPCSPSCRSASRTRPSGCTPSPSRWTV